MDINEIRDMTERYGEGFGHAHVQRVLKLIDMIGIGVDYDREIVTYAAYLHDWGAFPHFRQSGVDHAVRARQIAAQDILPLTTLPADTANAVLDAIEYHDYRDERPAPSIEALLLREADWLDFLGVIGVVREFAWGPNDLHRSYQRVIARRDAIRCRFTLPRAKFIAQQRLAEMNVFLDRLNEEALGHL